MDNYEADLRAITTSGPHTLEPEHYDFNRMVRDEIADILPIDDIHKKSDADLIFRFLIAYRWHPQKAGDAIREYAEWRKEMNLNHVLWESFPEKTSAMIPRFHGQDLGGYPIFYDRPSPTIVAELLAEVPRETLIRAHLKMMEQGRRLAKSMGVDRVTCVLDMSDLTIGIVRNPSAISLLKHFSSMDQKYYPENMRTIMITNSGWTFSTMYSIIRPLLDERVQKKIQIMGSGEKMKTDLAIWADLNQIPAEFGGTAEFGLPDPILQVSHLTPGIYPNPDVMAQPSDVKLSAADNDTGSVTDTAAIEASPEPGSHSEHVPSTEMLTAMLPPPPPPPPPPPRRQHAAGEIALHDSLTPSGLEITTAFTLGWPVAQLCGSDSVLDSTSATRASIRCIEGVGVVISEVVSGQVRYVVRPSRFSAFRKRKLTVSRPRDPQCKIIETLSGRATISGPTFTSLLVVPSNPMDLRDWSALSATRADDELITKRGSKIIVRKEMLSVHPAVLLALIAAVNQRWPY